MKIIKNKIDTKIEKIENIFFVNGGLPAPKDFEIKNNKSIPFFRISNIGEKNKLSIADTDEFLNYEKYKKNIAKKGSILVAKSGESINKKRKVRLLQDSIIVSHLAILEPKINNNYFYYLIKSSNLEDDLIKKSTMPSISLNDIKKYELIYIENIKQQENIAYILSTQEEQIEKIKGLIEKLETRNQYYAEKLLSGELRLRENEETGKVEWFENEEWQEVLIQGRKRIVPKDYNVKLLKDCDFIKLTRGKVISKNDIKNIPGEYPIYSSSVKNNGLMGNYGNYDFDKEMITWSVDGGGDLFYRPKHKFSVTNVSGIMTVDDKESVNLKYLYYLFSYQHKWFKFDYSNKAHPSVINEVYFYTDLNSNEQNLIVSCLDNMDIELNMLKEILSSEEKRFQWMLDNLLSGEYEVVTED